MLWHILLLRVAYGNPTLFEEFDMPSSTRPVMVVSVLAALMVLALVLARQAMPAPAPAPTPGPRYPATMQTRPAIPGGPTELFGTTRFLIHFTRTGEAAVPAADDDASGMPDYVEHIGRELERTWRLQVDVLGFAPPPTDGGLGGDDRFDVYLLPYEYFAVVISDGAYIYDNPNTAASEQRASFSYMILDNTFERYRDYGLTPFQALGTTAAHEFNHTLQYGYDAYEELWLMEATAALMEKLAYPAINDNIGYLPIAAEEPDACLPNRDPFYRPYSSWWLLKYLIERHPLGERLLPKIWEAARDRDGLEALNHTLNGDLVTYWQAWNVARLTRQVCPLNAPYCMAEAALYPNLLIEGRLTPNEWSGYLTYHPPDGLGALGVDMVDLTPLLATRLPFDVVVASQTPGVTMQARLVGLNARGRVSVHPVPLTGDPAGGTLRVNPLEFASLYLLVENPTLPLEAECGAAQATYHLGVTQPGARAFVQATARTPSHVPANTPFEAHVTLRALGTEDTITFTVTLPAGVEVLAAPGWQQTATAWLWQGNLTADPVTLTLRLQTAATFDLIADGHDENSEAFTLTSPVVVPAETLLVADPGVFGDFSAMLNVLDATGLPYDVWDTQQRGSPPAAVLALYPQVLWYTGQENVQTLTEANLTLLQNYVANGGRLVMQGTDLVAELLQAGTPTMQAFVRTTLQVDFVANTYDRAGGEVPLRHLSGVAMVLAVPPSEPEVGGPPDVLRPLGQARALWLYPDGGAAGGAAITQTPDGMVLVLALDVAQLSAEAATRLLAELLSWR